MPKNKWQSIVSVLSLFVLYNVSWLITAVILFILSLVLNGVGIDTRCGDNHPVPLPPVCGPLWSSYTHNIIAFLIVGSTIFWIYRKYGKEKVISVLTGKVLMIVVGVYLFFILLFQLIGYLDKLAGI